jgi:hypothetical protein
MTLHEFHSILRDRWGAVRAVHLKTGETHPVAAHTIAVEGHQLVLQAPADVDRLDVPEGHRVVTTRPGTWVEIPVSNVIGLGLEAPDWE